MSIVIPTHNYAGYVGQAIRSALQQGYQPIEIVVVDDGSTDETPAVLREFGRTIRIVRLDGRGVSMARNAGLAQARGEYIVLLDADDLLVPGGVAAQVARFEGRPDLDAVIGDWYTCDVPSGIIVRSRSALRGGDVLRHLVRANIVATPSAVMLRRTTLVGLGGFDTSLSFTADWEMWLRLAKRRRGFARVAAATAVYRVHGRSMTSRLDRAIDDMTALLDRCFGDPALPESLRALEPESRFATMMYLGRLCLQRDDHARADECVRGALHWKADAIDTLHFYRGLAEAMSRASLRSGRAAVDVVQSMFGFCAELDDGRDAGPARREALRHLAAGIIARNARERGLALHHFRVAARKSWRTVLAPPQLGWTVRLLLPAGAIRGARQILDTIRVGARGSVPAAVRALLRAGGESRILEPERPGRRLGRWRRGVNVSGGGAAARRAVSPARAWLTPPTLVLMYHRIATLETDPWQLAVTPLHFAEHLEVVRRHGRLLRVQELSRALADGRVPRRAIVVTLDDGYADNLHHAVPLLERYDVPATVFVTAGYVGRPDGFWWDQLERLILTPVDLPPTLRLEVGGRGHEYRLDAMTVGVRGGRDTTAAWRAWTTAPTARDELFLALYRLLRPLSEPDRRRALADLSAWSSAAAPTGSTGDALSVLQLQTLASRPLVEIGAHTLTHPQLSTLTPADQQAEIHGSRVALEEITGTRVMSFAYPYGGRSDYTVETVRLVGEAGFSAGCASFPGPVTRMTPRYEVPRCHVEDCDGDGLARRLATWSAAWA